MWLISCVKKIILSSILVVLFSNLVYSAVYFAVVKDDWTNASTWSDTPAGPGGAGTLSVLGDLTVDGASIFIGNGRHMYIEGNLLINSDCTTNNTSSRNLTVGGNNTVYDTKGDNVYLFQDNTTVEINLSFLHKGIYIINLAISEKVFSYRIKKKWDFYWLVYLWYLPV